LFAVSVLVAAILAESVVSVGLTFAFHRPPDSEAPPNGTTRIHTALI
jgi:hypothetical protein